MRAFANSTKLGGTVSALLLTLLLAQPSGAAHAASARPATSGDASAYPIADQLATDVTGSDVYRHLQALQQIADTSDGNRGYDKVGFTRSVRYVSGLMKAAGYHVVEQSVPYTDFDVQKEQLVVSGAGEGDGDTPVLMTRFTPSTGPAGIDAPLVSLPTGRTGCNSADYDGVPAAGAIVVLARAACGYGVQQQVAAGAGARAFLLYYPTPSPENIYRLIGFTPPAYTIPVASVSQREGEILARAAAGGGVRVHLTLRAQDVPRTTVNLVAETAGGDPDNVVLVGGHLDSVTEGPGINDNGSTAATVLQTALELAPYQRTVTNKVRFVWWGAEELVDIGSDYYVSQLTSTQRQQITAVVNGELIASPNYARFVWDSGSGGGHVIADLFAAYFDSKGLPYDRESPDDIGSDHLPFEAAGIPVAGIDGGNLNVKTPAQQERYGGEAGQMFDHCYHQACDRLDDINREALDDNAPAMAWVLGRLATYDEDVRAAAQGTGRLQ
ncbi:M28 family peptidase [Streptomyces sp. NPDC020917]|uniref:M28 family peptidase n=1 Tax=Streptomyces sp. NPDC020917 TaxID=3365102 RepID=UPI0037A7C3E8